MPSCKGIGGGSKIGGTDVDEQTFRTWISGEKAGVLPVLFRAALTGPSLAYRLGILARNRAYDHNWKRVFRADVPVLSVGNITTGGTGKTPIVAYLARWFRDRHVRVTLLSRGYRALPGEVNDEKLVLDQLCPDVPHLQNPDRVAAAKTACEQHDCDVLILDDGFQHRRLARDLDIVLIDALNPWGYGNLLPRGLLREPLGALRRADLVILTRADQCPDERRHEILDRLSQIRGDNQSIEVAFSPKQLRNASGQTEEFSSLAGQTIVAFCGLGNPDGFRRTLDDLRLHLKMFRPFSDHHHYTTNELDTLGQQAMQHAAAAVLTTQKDLVKINRDELDGCPLWAVEIGTNFIRNQRLLDQRLQQVFETKQTSNC